MKYRIPIEAANNVIAFEDLVKRESIPDMFAIVAKDNTMAPRIVKGDRLIIHKQSDVKPHDVVVVITNGKLICRELLRREGDMLLLNPWNEKLSTEIYNSEDIQIIGKVIEMRRRIRK